MIFARRTLSALCFTLLLASLTPRLCSGQPAPAQPAPVSTAAPTAQAQPASTQAYTLPPEKLTKAIRLSHIQLALDIIGSLWGLIVLWLLLATRWAAGLAAWAERLLRRRWLQGLLFFAAFIVITTLADLPLDIIGHAVSRSYGISVQGWGSWLGDLAKAPGPLAGFWHAGSAALQLDRPRLAAPLLGLDLADLAAADFDFGLCLLRCSIPSSTNSNRSQRRMPRWSPSWKPSSPAPEPTFLQTACS